MTTKAKLLVQQARFILEQAVRERARELLLAYPEGGANSIDQALCRLAAWTDVSKELLEPTLPGTSPAPEPAPAPPVEPEKPAPECTSAYSTVRTVEGAVELLKDDWELGYSHSSGRYWLQTELCKGGPSRKLAANVFRALLKRGVIIRAPKQANDPYWLTRYILNTL